MRKSESDLHMPVAFFDVLLNAFLMILFVFFVTPHEKYREAPTKDDGNLFAIERFRISATWNGERDDDIDLYVADPLGHIVFYQNVEDGLMHLERDDLGRYSDTIATPHSSYEAPYNQENVIIRGFIPGEYTVNLHVYRKASSGPVDVLVALYDFQGKDARVKHRTITLSHYHEEKTAFRFTVDERGALTDVNIIPREMVMSTTRSSFFPEP